MFDFRRESQTSSPTDSYSPESPTGNPPNLPYDSSQSIGGRPRSFGLRAPLSRPAARSLLHPQHLQQQQLHQGGLVQQADGELVHAPRPDVKEKEKIYRFEYRYDDSDTIMRELEEFYPYVEMPELNDMPERFNTAFGGEWMDAGDKRRRQFIEEQLDCLESRRFDKRRSAQQSLLYLLLGNFGEAVYPEMQLTYIFNNARLIRSLDGVASLVVALKDASRRYTEPGDDKQSSGQIGVDRGNGYPAGVSGENQQELMDVLGMLYFLVEVCRTDESFGDELMATTPPLPLLLFQMVASLKDQLPNGYPVKKVLLLLWKTLLACLGGMKEVNTVKRFAREIADLPTTENQFTKSSPLDITTWRNDMSMKYPTFAPPSSSDSLVSNEKLAESINPIPARPNYHSTELPPSSPRNGFGGAPPLPGTPAPSPPPSPIARQKKQQFQTDPTKPFLFPYSRVPNSADPTSLVPFAISEADKLYHQHAYVSLGTFQMWQVREDCMREERGLGHKGLIGFEPLTSDEDDDADDDMLRLEWKYEMEEMELEGAGDTKGAAAARNKKMDARRLRRVEIIYKNTLPIMQSCVVVLLKLLLAAVTGPGAASGASGGIPQDFTSPSADNPPDEARPAPPLSREEIDISRHKEITSKAVSAILILLLKWFKVSHVMKFHYFGQLLFDSNCLLLVLKMFGLSDVLQAVQANNEVPDWNLFRYCYLNCCHTAKREPGTPPNLRSAPTASMTSTDATGAEVETFYEFSWRNFFSTINFLKVLQKMTKHRHHRTWMLSQYKSSQILKRMLKVQQPMLQLQVLKLIKSQMPWCGRKWRQANMKVITAIYLNCRPELHDEWLSGTDLEAEGDESIPQEYALRSLIAFYNKRNYAAQLQTSQPEPSHQRADSSSAGMLEDPVIGAHRPSATEDVFPPRRTSDAGASYNPDGMIEFWLHEYEDVLHEVFGAPEEDMDDFGLIVNGVGGLSLGEGGRSGSVGSVGAAEMDGPAWRRLGELMRAGGRGVDDEEISDSESTVSVGELGEDARMPGSNAKLDAQAFQAQHTGENTWAEMSPKTLSLLPRSPAERRRSSSSSSSGPSLRPAIPKNLDALIGDDPFENLGAGDVEEEEELGPMPIQRSTVDERERQFGAVDEVEYAYGE